MKNNKCKDPHGHINELYKRLGNKGLTSLLLLFNRIKQEIIIPEALRLSNVSTIYKGKGAKNEVINLRGIFKLPIVRNILDKLIHQEDKKLINSSMGQFQVGNQTGRSIRDHTFVIHAIVNEAQINKIDIDIQFTDIKQCFDSIWLEEAINDLFDSGVQSRNLNLLYESNSSTQMCVETNAGQSDRVELKRIVMQGSVNGGTLCSNQISKLCHKSYNEGNVYLYRNKIPVPALAMVDDITSVAMCNSVAAIKNNVQIDEFIKAKKMEGQVGEGKCQWVHIGKGECHSSYVANGVNTTQCSKYKYLGDHVSKQWDNLYQKRYERAQAYSISCQAMCTEMSLGFQMYDIAKLLHQAMFLNGSLVNMETWPHFTIDRVMKFERAEQGLFRKILSAHSKTPIESLYLELGIIPFRYRLMERRILYAHLVFNRDDDEITKKIMMVQKEEQLPGDFYTQLYNDLLTLGITEGEVSSSDKYNLETKTKNRTKEHAYNYLIGLAKGHSKINEKMYEDMNGMPHLNDPRFTPDLINLLFKFRTRMFNVRNNFRNKYKETNILCPLCKGEEDSQKHIFHCPSIQEHLQINQQQYPY